MLGTDPNGVGVGVGASVGDGDGDDTAWGRAAKGNEDPDADPRSEPSTDATSASMTTASPRTGDFGLVTYASSIVPRCVPLCVPTGRRFFVKSPHKTQTSKVQKEIYLRYRLQG